MQLPVIPVHSFLLSCLFPLTLSLSFSAIRKQEARAPSTRPRCTFASMRLHRSTLLTGSRVTHAHPSVNQTLSKLTSRGLKRRDSFSLWTHGEQMRRLVAHTLLSPPPHMTAAPQDPMRLALGCTLWVLGHGSSAVSRAPERCLIDQVGAQLMQDEKRYQLKSPLRAA